MVQFDVVESRIALVTIDLQRCFVDGMLSGLNGLDVVRRVNEIASTCRSVGIPVIHVRQVLRADGSNAGVFGEIHPFVHDGFFAADSPHAAFHDELVVDRSDIVIEKPRYGAFHGTDLEVILRSRGIDSVIIGGIATDVCCDTTAREAMMRDFRVFFLEDGTTTGPIGEISAAQAHALAIARIAVFYAQVISVHEMIQLLSPSARATH